MSQNPFPPVVHDFPRGATGAGSNAWISQSATHQVVFVEFDAGVESAPHSHGEQWGIVVEGLVDFTIGGRTVRCARGDTHHIPAGVVHSARFMARTWMIEVFADADRYKARSGEA